MKSGRRPCSVFRELISSRNVTHKLSSISQSVSQSVIRVPIDGLSGLFCKQETVILLVLSSGHRTR